MRLEEESGPAAFCLLTDYRKAQISPIIVESNREKTAAITPKYSGRIKDKMKDTNRLEHLQVLKMQIQEINGYHL
jgi:glucose-6-phosphate dehydrogenase assembly protein OpcA